MRTPRWRLPRGAPRRAMTRPPPTPPTERPWTVRRRRRGRSSCASTPPEPDLDRPRNEPAWPNPTLSSPSPPPQRRRRRSGAGRRSEPNRPVRPTAARRVCRAEPRPALASLDAREAPSIRPADRRLIRPSGDDAPGGAAPRQRSPFRMISRSCAAAADRPGGPADDRGAPLVDPAAARRYAMTARIHGISQSCASQAIRPLTSVRRSPRRCSSSTAATAPGSNALSPTLSLARDLCDRAIERIRVLAPPASRSEDIARARAGKSQEEEEVVTLDTVMPNTIGQVDDELQTIAGTVIDATDLTVGGRRLPGRAADQCGKQGQGQHPVAGVPARGLTSTAAASGRRNAPAPARRHGRAAARAPRAGARAASGGCGQEEELTGRPCLAGRRRAGRGSADYRIPAAEELAREVDAALARLSADDAHEADGGPHEAWSPCMAIKISGAGSSGNNDDRTPGRSGRSGRVVQPWSNIVANAAMRTGTNAFDRCVPGAGRPPWRRASGAHIVSESSTTTTSVPRVAGAQARGDRRALRRLRDLQHGSQYSAAARTTARSPPSTTAISSDGRSAATLARASRPTSFGSSCTGTRTDVRTLVREAVEGRYRRATRAFAVHSHHRVDRGGHASGRGDSVRYKRGVIVESEGHK